MNSKKCIEFFDPFSGQKWEFWSNMRILVKNGNFGQKWEFYSKMGILVKNGNFGQKWEFWSKMGILVKNGNFKNFVVNISSQFFVQNSKFR